MTRLARQDEELRDIPSQHGLVPLNRRRPSRATVRVPAVTTAQEWKRPRMPKVPQGFDWDLEGFGSRFTLRPALAFALGEDASTREDVEVRIGPDVLAEVEELGGEPNVGPAGIGRGATGPAVAVEFLLQPALGGLIGYASVWAVQNLVKRAREALGHARGALFISRGTAAFLAAAAVAQEYDEGLGLILEAAEEPSSIAGAPASELSYTGIEPWVVLLTNAQCTMRYVVVVAGDGDVVGIMRVGIGGAERLFMSPPAEDKGDSEVARGLD